MVKTYRIRGRWETQKWGQFYPALTLSPSYLLRWKEQDYRPEKLLSPSQSCLASLLCVFWVPGTVLSTLHALFVKASNTVDTIRPFFALEETGSQRVCSRSHRHWVQSWNRNTSLSESGKSMLLIIRRNWYSSNSLLSLPPLPTTHPLPSAKQNQIT